MVRIIGRISKKGVEYYQHALNEDEGTVWIPVFLKKGVEKLNFETKEKKVDSRGEVYTLYNVKLKNVFFPVEAEDAEIQNEEGLTIPHPRAGKIAKAIIME